MRAMRAVAAKQPRRFDCFFATARRAEWLQVPPWSVCVRPTSSLFALNGNAKTVAGARSANPFRFRLGETEDKRIRTRDRAHIDCGDLFLLIVDAETTQSQSGGERLVDYAYCLEDFERAWKNAERLRRLRTFGGLIDNAARNAVPNEFACHRQANRPGADN